MNVHADILIIGGGPAGIAAAIAARQKGLSASVLDARTPPIDKPCGEGLLPQGVEALGQLGIHLTPNSARPFYGISFVDEKSSVWARFPGTPGFALRRVRLHQMLVDRAVESGVEFHWGMHVTDVQPDYVVAGGRRYSYNWLVGADGQHSMVRKWAGLDSAQNTGTRFAFRRHYEIAPWGKGVEVHWAKDCQLIVTPTGDREVGVAVFSRNPRLRLDPGLLAFPAISAKLAKANPVTSEMGDVTSLRRLSSVKRGKVVLVGDASGSVDAVTGHGLSLAFQQSLVLADALLTGDLSPYESAHRKLGTVSALMTRFILFMEGRPWLQRRSLRLLERTPETFAKLLSIHAGSLPLSSFGLGEAATFGWKLLRTQP